MLTLDLTPLQTAPLNLRLSTLNFLLLGFELPLPTIVKSFLLLPHSLMLLPPVQLPD